MSHTTDLRALLVADLPLTALVGTRIYADRAEQSTIRPFVLIDLQNANYANCLDAALDDELVSSEFMVSCFADRRSDAEAIGDLVYTALKASGQRVSSRTVGFSEQLDIFTSDLGVVWM